MSLVLVKLDYLALVLESQGRQAVDNVVQTFGRVLREQVRVSDVAARASARTVRADLPNTNCRVRAW